VRTAIHHLSHTPQDRVVRICVTPYGKFDGGGKLHMIHHGSPHQKVQVGVTVAKKNNLHLAVRVLCGKPYVVTVTKLSHHQLKAIARPTDSKIEPESDF
jgi:hypothetical protein